MIILWSVVDLEIWKHVETIFIRMLVIPCLLRWLWMSISGLKQTNLVNWPMQKVQTVSRMCELFTTSLGNFSHKAVGALTWKANWRPDSSCAWTCESNNCFIITCYNCESLSWTHVTTHTIWSSLLSDDDDVLDEDELDDALPGFATFVDGGLSCRTLAEKRMVAIAMEPNQNLLLGVNVASKTFSCVRLTKLLKNHCMKPKKMAKMKPPPSSPWGH